MIVLDQRNRKRVKDIVFGEVAILNTMFLMKVEDPVSKEIYYVNLEKGYLISNVFDEDAEVETISAKLIIS